VRPLACLAVLLAVPAAAQVKRLVDTIEAPLAYLCLEAMPAAEQGARQAGPVQRLLADPSLDALFGAGVADTGSGDAAAPSGSTRALALVRGVLGRSSGELELALTGIVPSAGQPLLVLRARLQRAEADSLQMALDANELAAPVGRVGGRTTYRLRSAGKDGPGSQVDLALVGADLLVGNDSSAMREVLDPAPARTSAAQPSMVLAADPRFVAMRQKLPVAPGALWLYGDWRRLGDRVQTSLDGLPGALMGSSGLGSARAVMASVAAAQADFTMTVLLDFDVAPAPAAGPNAGPRSPRHGPPRPDGPRGGDEHGPRRGVAPGIDGWFAAVEPVAARTLLTELPAGGLGGLVLSVDLAEVVSRSRTGVHLWNDLRRAFDQYGLDFDRNVLARLGTRGTVQLHVAPGGDSASVGAVYAVRTKNRKAAAELFADIRRVAEPAGLATASTRDVAARDGKDGKDRRSVDLLELRGGGPHGRATAMFVAAHEDSLLLSADADVLATVVDDARRAGKPQKRRGEPTAAAISSIGGETVAGLFDVDLLPLFERITDALAGTGARVDLSALPKRHVGYLDLQRGDDGTVVRVRLLSSR
jgi:hypothetical protein